MTDDGRSLLGIVSKIEGSSALVTDNDLRFTMSPTRSMIGKMGCGGNTSNSGDGGNSSYRRRKRRRDGSRLTSPPPRVAIAILVASIACCYFTILISTPSLLLLPLVDSRPPPPSSSSSSISGGGSGNSIPRSNNRYTNYFNEDIHSSTSSTDDLSSSTTTTTSSSSSQPYHPPWNPSPHINSNGFFNEYYSRIPGTWEHAANIRGKHGVHQSSKQLHSIPVQIRQVPGDGNCLFHSIAICLYHATNNNNHNHGGTGGYSGIGEDGYWECLFGPWRSRGLGNTSRSAGSEEQQQQHHHRQQLQILDQRQHLPMDTMENIAQLRRTSLALRNAAVDVLSSSSTSSSSSANHPGRVGFTLGFGGLSNLISRGGDTVGILGKYTIRSPSFSSSSRRLFLQGDEYISSSELLNAASSQFNIDGEEYCSLMRNEGYWGGGPEIVALCNYLKRPIHVYELIPKEDSSIIEVGSEIGSSNKGADGGGSNECRIRTSDRFTLRRMACFGSPKFDRNSPLHILSADSRFPDVDPKRVRKAGNHFLALFPLSPALLQQQQQQQCQQEEGRSNNNRNRLAKHALMRGGTISRSGIPWRWWWRDND